MPYGLIFNFLQMRLTENETVLPKYSTNSDKLINNKFCIIIVSFSFSLRGLKGFLDFYPASSQPDRDFLGFSRAIRKRESRTGVSRNTSCDRSRLGNSNSAESVGTPRKRVDVQFSLQLVEIFSSFLHRFAIDS